MTSYVLVWGARHGGWYFQSTIDPLHHQSNEIYQGYLAAVRARVTLLRHWRRRFVPVPSLRDRAVCGVRL
jgi:hypothetical protein